MVGLLNEMNAFLQFIYNNLLIYDFYDKAMTPPNEGALAVTIPVLKKSRNERFGCPLR